MLKFGGVQTAQKTGADSLDLLAVGAQLVELKQFLRPAAALPHIHHIVHHQVIAAKHMIPLVKADVGQLLILVGSLIQRLFHQLPGKNIRRVLVVPAVGQVDMGLAHGGDRIPLPDIPGGGTESVSDGQPLAAGVGNVHLPAEFGQGLLLHQEIA